MGSAVKRRHHRPRVEAQWLVINELPDPLPINKEELDAIERHFDGIINLCLQGGVQTEGARDSIRSSDESSHFPGNGSLTIPVVVQKILHPGSF